MNKKARMALASRIKSIAEEHGAKVEIEDCPEHRCAHVDCKFPDVSISMDIDSIFNGGQMAHWYGAKRHLRMTYAVDSVNECHRHKATMFAQTEEFFIERFAQGCKMIASGEAFI